MKQVLVRIEGHDFTSETLLATGWYCPRCGNTSVGVEKDDRTHYLCVTCVYSFHMQGPGAVKSERALK